MAALSSKIDIVQELEHNRRRYLTLIDLDCFYAQVEAKRYNIDSSIPLAVQQWGAVIAVNYKSREFGVKRGDTLNEIRKKCPNIRLCHVDVVNENGEIIPGKFNKEYHDKYKVTLELYRKANFKILDIFRKFTPLVERASIDEAYIDLTDVVNKKYDLQYKNTNTDLSNEWMGNVIGGSFNPINEQDIKLLICSQIVHQIRMAVLDELGYTCSAGVAHNKKFAKMISSMNKPNGQSVLPTCGLTELLSNCAFTKLQGFGGKLGQKLINEFNVTTFSDITEKVGFNKLCDVVDESTAIWIWRICHGIDEEEVKIVANVKRIGSSKNLRGVYKLEDVVKHLRICASEMLVRIRGDRKLFHRIAKTLAISYRTRAHGLKSLTTMMIHLPTDDILTTQHGKYCDMLTKHAAKLLPKENGMEYTNVGLSVSGFVDQPKQNIMNMWNTASKNKKNKNVAFNSNNRQYMQCNISVEVKNTKKAKSNGIEKFLVKHNGKKMNVNVNNGCDVNSDSNSKKKKRKRKGAMFQYLKHKKDISNSNQPPLKRRKLNEDVKKDIICDKCKNLICNGNDDKRELLIQTHMDSHLANELSRQLNTIPRQVMPKKSRKKNSETGIMNYFKHK